MEQNETLREIAKWNQNYERFKKDHNTVENIVPMSLLLQWDDFSWETHANILHAGIAKKAKEDPTFEFWIRNPSYSWIGLTELMSVMLSNKGRVYSLDKDALLLPSTADNGEVYYPFDREWMFASRAVAQNFVQKEKELAQYHYGALAVNHINGVLHDNSSLNLAWTLPSQEVLEVYNSPGAEPVQGGRRAILISVQDPKGSAKDYHQFVLLGNKDMLDLGLDPAYIHQATTLKPWKAPFRARYLGAGEAAVFPRTPPEFLKPNLNMLKSPDQQVPESWVD